ncbi:MAG: heme ABC transporter permease [Pseudomonadota bacterium]
MQGFANPLRFQRLADRILPWVMGALVVATPIGLYMALVVAPADYQQGEAYRIIFVHVPAAWMALFTYAMIAIAGVVSLVWRHPLAEISAKAAAPIGATFTAIALVTGAVWGKPMWGTYWVWDARLTSVLILFFLYLGLIALHDAFDDPQKGGRAAAILAIVGAVNLPIIKFSVDWWNTLHQPASIMRLDGPSIHPSMLWPLLTMVLVYHLYLIAVLLLRIKAELAVRRVYHLRLAASG